MALFKKSDEAASTPQPEPAVTPGGKKNVPTPSRREAEAARRARLNPQLSPKEARKRDRDAQYAARQRDFANQESSPARQLVRDVVDSRLNPASVALPIMLGLLALTLVPQFMPYLQWFVYATWAYILLIVFDAILMWRKVKDVLAQRLPGTPLRGLFMYAFNRQMTFRRWRRPAPRVQRGENL